MRLFELFFFDKLHTTLSNFGWQRAFRSAYFWVPSLLALLDLVFYALVPFILLSSVAPSRNITEGSLQYTVMWAANALSVDAVLVQISLILSIILTRIIGTRFAERIFARSVSKSYAQNSCTLLSHYLAVVAECKNTDTAKVRKAINAEVSNLHFGFHVPAAFIAAESLLVLTIIAYATLLFGAAIVMFAIGVSVTIFLILHFIRKKSASVGRARSTFEQQRLEITETALSSAFSTSVNGGRRYLLNRFNSLTQNFALALGQQVVLPYSTKALIDGALAVFVLVLLTQSGLTYSPTEMVILGGMSVRAIPSLSRISSYVETMRINAIASSEITAVMDRSNLSDAVPRNEELYDKLSALPKTGLYFVMGASGIGKTTTVNQWVMTVGGKKSVAYLEQAGFVSSTAISDYFAMVGLSDQGALATKDRLHRLGIAGNRLSHLSGGQAKFLQFVALSQKQADIFVFDEPSVGLDAQLQEAMGRMLVEISRNALVIVVSHDRDFVTSLIEDDRGEIIEVA